LVLDTDHVSALGIPSETGRRLLERIDANGGEAATTIITVEEQLRGWLAEIHRLAAPADMSVRFRREGIRIGSMDLKIACIALAHGAILLT